MPDIFDEMDVFDAVAVDEPQPKAPAPDIFDTIELDSNAGAAGAAPGDEAAPVSAQDALPPTSRAPAQPPVPAPAAQPSPAPSAAPVRPAGPMFQDFGSERQDALLQAAAEQQAAAPLLAPRREADGAMASAGREAGRAAAPTAAAGAAAVAGAKAGAAIGAPLGPWGAVGGGVLGALAGAMGAGWVANKLQDAAIRVVRGETTLDELNRQMAENRKAHPLATLGGELAPQAIVFRVNPQTLGRAGGAAKALLAGRKVAVDEALALADVAVGAGTAGAQEAVAQYREGNAEPLRLMAAVVAGALLNDSRLFGQVAPAPKPAAAKPARKPAATLKNLADLPSDVAAQPTPENVQALEAPRAEVPAVGTAEPARPVLEVVEDPSIPVVAEAGREPAGQGSPREGSTAVEAQPEVPAVEGVQTLEAQASEVTAVGRVEESPATIESRARSVSLPEASQREIPAVEAPDNARSEVGVPDQPTPEAVAEVSQAEADAPTALPGAGQGNKPAGRSFIRGASFRDLKYLAKKAKFGTGDTVEDRIRGTGARRTADEYRRALMDHYDWWHQATGTKPRARMSPETKAKLRDAQRAARLRRENEAWDASRQAWERMQSEEVDAGRRFGRGTDVYVEGDDALWRVMDGGPTLRAEGDATGPTFSRERWSYTLTDGERTIEVPAEQVRDAPAFTEDDADASFEFWKWEAEDARSDAGQSAPAGAVDAGVRPESVGSAGGGRADGGTAEVGAGADAGRAGDGFALESATPEQLAGEQARAEQQAEIARRQAEPLVGRPVDTTGDLFDQTAAEAPLFAPRPPRIGGSKAGAVLLPQVDPKDAASARRFLGRWFGTRRGMGTQASDVVADFQGMFEGARLEAVREWVMVRDMVAGLVKRGANADAVRDSVVEFQDGRLDEAGFAGRFGLSPTGPEVGTLRAMRDVNARRARELARWEGLSDDQATHIEANLHYQTRAYMADMLGSEYRPSAQAKADAITEVQNGLAALVAEVERRAGNVRGQRIQFDVISFLETGDVNMLNGLAPTRRDAALHLLDRYREIRGLIDGLQYQGNQVVAARNARALRDASEGIVDYYLERKGQGGQPGSNADGVAQGNLRERFLGPVFRALYGEIKDPSMRQRITAEVQGRMLAQMTLMNRMVAELEGVAWDYRPNPERGFVVKLGDGMNPVAARRRYGDMAGRYVTEDLKLALEGPQHAGPAWEWIQTLWVKPQAIWRLSHLALNPRTIMRNWGSSIIGNAVSSGDAFNPTWWRHFRDGHKIFLGYFSKNPKALGVMVDMADRGVFRVDSSSISQDLALAESAFSSRLPRAMLQSLARFYGMVDFMSKYASYMSNTDAGGRYGRRPPMTPEQAVEHVRQMYQNRDRVPRVFDRVSAAGLADFAGYTADSVRFSVNQLRYAAREAAAGNMVPMAGFMASRALWYMILAQTVAAVGTAAWAKIHARMRETEEDRNALKYRGLGNKELAPLRNMVAEYDRNMPMFAWWEQKPNGQKELYYTILGGQTADPAEDWIIGALQSPATGQSYFEALGNNATEQFGLAGYPSLLMKLAIGRDLTGKTFTQSGAGLADVFGKPHPETWTVLGDAARQVGVEMLGGTLPDTILQLNKQLDERRAGQKKGGMFENTATPQDTAAKLYRLVRTYRVEQTDLNDRFKQSIRDYAKAIDESERMISDEMDARLNAGGSTAEQRQRAKDGEQKRKIYLARIEDRARDLVALVPEWYPVPMLSKVIQQASNGALNQTDATIIAIRAAGKAKPNIPPYVPNPMRIYDHYRTGDWNR